MSAQGAWHPDPTGAHEYRWWNGSEWTDQVADGGVTSTDPLPGPDAEVEADDAHTQEAEGVAAVDSDAEPFGATTDDDTVAGVAPAPSDAGSSWWTRNQAALLAGLGAAVIGVAAGALIVWATMNSELDDERAVNTDLQAELDAAMDELEEARESLGDRDARRRADEAEAARLEAEREREEREAQEAAQRAAEEQAAAEAAAAAERREIPRDGTFEVGRDIDPGRWRTEGGGGCYWAILSEPTGALGSIVTNSFGSGPQIVDIAEGQYFETSGCGTWRLD